MPRYVQLVNLTQTGIDRFEETPELLDQARALAADLGGEIVDFYLTMGRYDAVVVFDAPDAKSAVVGTIASAMEGTIETETLRAFDEGEVDEILQALPG